MDFFKNFVNQMFNNMPIAAKVAMVNHHLNNYLKDIVRDEKFCTKFIKIIEMFIDRDMTVKDVYDILDAVDGIRLTYSQIDYFCKQVYSNHHILMIMQNFVDYRHLTEDEIVDLSQFLVKELDNAFMVE
ncbi:unknown protein [Spodoptera frugiperda multiple nucleopolyhedrovirus]|uniref:Sf93 n=1 Tax=Spodoptera frugiperda nuclear polyhedrosis virus TaxID=10455 RepID=A1YJ83_NPVSF|nr:hypothetical protein SFMNPV_gp093 [Spodoptera frugiperda multiple nucleopolyhedrovirus]ABM45803.1 unknown protein [Spodoptera frugiperda multiple nucleopolyhedrovirus]ACA02650.1 unknown [Spodoptera frugiperda multiple nucleopolyhedrovirus]ADV91326.1 hypothetical protein Sf93 [Spodoptera frugiperda multiple nucleopolyhedrovirus]AFH59037.1 hypothetical protein Sf93 [Spodoptera frugiperda multiple nucleopolyhedrovirus]AIW01504.1 hypothetical protein [Spodoptera frugiperda multiple nucleopolyhe